MAEDPMKADRSGAYITGSLNGSTWDKNKLDLGAAAGYQIMPYARAEVTVDHAFQTGNKTGNMVMGNVIGQYRIPSSSITPYVLLGAGVGSDRLGTNKDGTAMLWNAGAGVRVAVSQSVDLDLRYRNVRPIEAKHAVNKDLHLFGAGVSYRF
jgi:opacity protein-like surface antigen